MSFTSTSFLFLFALFLILYSLIPIRFRLYLLFAGSLGFAFLSSELTGGFVCLVAIVCFALAKGVTRVKNRQPLLICSIVFHFGVLAAAKLFLDELPVGISFYTFACFSYFMDVYRNACKAEDNPITFVTYVSLFPKFQMGPITRYGELAPRLKKPRVTLKGMQAGLEQFCIGFCMKVLLADRIAILWNELRTIGYASLSTPLAWLGLAGFSMQLYLEWQSYSLMAIGVGRMLGFTLPQNFNYPYLAKSVGDFYRRWHMTLTRWFKDYVYIPLGGNRIDNLHTTVNILCVWFLTSIWHGIGWNYLLWGMSIGVLIVLEKLFLGKWLEKGRILPHIYVLFFIMLTWCCFKITKLDDLQAYFSRLFPFFGGNGNVFVGDFHRVITRYWGYLLCGVLFCFPLPETVIRRLSKHWFFSILLALVFWFAVSVAIKQGSNTMMYLNF